MEAGRFLGGAGSGVAVCGEHGAPTQDLAAMEQFFVDEAIRLSLQDGNAVNRDTGSHKFQISVTDPDPQAHDSKG